MAGSDGKSGHEKEKEEYLDRYVRFLNENGRTVREVADGIEEMARANGFVDYEDIASGKSGSNRIILRLKRSRKIVGLGVLGTKDIAKGGIKIGASHIDFPDFRLKPGNPIIANEGETIKLDLVQNGGFIPSERAGCIYVARGGYVDRDGNWKKLKPIRGALGVLLPHVNRSIEKEPLEKAYSSDQWDLDTGFGTKEELLEAMGLPSESEFKYADIEIVPDHRAFVAGRNVVGPHQDDLSCTFAGVMAIVDAAKEGTENTCLFIGTNNEEIGSEGYDGARGAIPKMWITQLVREQRKRQGLGYEGLSEEAFVLEKVLQNSIVISADVTNGYDSTYGKLDKKYVAKLGGGPSLSTTGREKSRGLTCDTPVETKRWLTNVLEKKGVKYQEDMLSGKLDNDAGGLTVANMFGNLGAIVIEFSIPMKNMHSPIEVADKNDNFEFYRGVKAVYLEK